MDDEAGEKQHHVEADSLPYADHAQRIERGAAVLQPAMTLQSGGAQKSVHQPELRVQHELPDDRHRDQRCHHGKEIDGAVPAPQARAALDQERCAEPERYRARHHNGDIGQRVLQRNPEHPVGEHLVIIRQADPGERWRAELVVRERQCDQAGERTDQHHQHQHEGRRGQRVGGPRRRAGIGKRPRLGTRRGGHRLQRGGGVRQRPSPAAARFARRWRSRCACRQRRRREPHPAQSHIRPRLRSSAKGWDR